MRHSVLPLFLAGMILLLIATAPVSAAWSTISAISPAVGYTGKTMTVTITGENFPSTEGDVRLTMSGEDIITATPIPSWSDARIVCKFKISSSRATGDGDLVVIRGYDDREAVKSGGYTIASPMTLTSIFPTSGQANNESIAFTLGETGLSYVSDVILSNENYDNITADTVDVVSAVKIKGTFDLTDADDATYDVCLVDSYGTEECDLSFEVTTDAVGSMVISSTPADASISMWMARTLEQRPVPRIILSKVTPRSF